MGRNKIYYTKERQQITFISNFIELNKYILHQLYTLPKIQDILLRIKGFCYGTTLYLNMGYYYIELSAKSKELCTIVNQWEKYVYQKIPMGMCNSPDISQEKMSELFVCLEKVRFYINGHLHVTKGSWDNILLSSNICSSASRRLVSRSTQGNHALAPTNLTIWVITSLVTGLCPYQRKLRPFKPS